MESSQLPLLIARDALEYLWKATGNVHMGGDQRRQCLQA